MLLYVHYFYSPLTDELEIMSMDKRYESNADSIGRIRAEDQLASNIHTSYTIVGNMVAPALNTLLIEYGQSLLLRMGLAGWRTRRGW